MPFGIGYPYPTLPYPQWFVELHAELLRRQRAQRQTTENRCHCVCAGGRRTGKAAGLADGVHAVAAAREDLVPVRLMPHIPHKLRAPSPASPLLPSFTGAFTDASKH